ncbi:hypothetical protein [Candidatus Uabimicrobium sp. HlEnr_7]|uniref:hypothetical protein n=1 Tax=Candidatus Uabimicrobium helgolandensis TaxID=3095367 RepID=UPI003555E957
MKTSQGRAEIRKKALVEHRISHQVKSQERKAQYLEAVKTNLMDDVMLLFLICTLPFNIEIHKKTSYRLDKTIRCSSIEPFLSLSKSFRARARKRARAQYYWRIIK